MFLYLHNRFRTSSRVLSLLTERLGRCGIEARRPGGVCARRTRALVCRDSARVQSQQPVMKAVTSDTRTQLLPWARKALASQKSHGTRDCGSEVDVLLGPCKDAAMSDAFSAAYSALDARMKIVGRHCKQSRQCGDNRFQARLRPHP
jgi:hypothetical protein